MRGHQKPPPQTTTQRTAKHRLAVKERMARMEFGLKAIINRFVAMRADESNYYEAGFEDGLRAAAEIAQEALSPADPAKF